MLVPYNVDVPMERRPIANWVLIGITYIVSAKILHDVGGSDPTYPAYLDYVLLQRGEDFSILQLVGHVLTHGGLAHLIGNMVFLFCFGNAINAKLGHAVFVATYLALGIVAAVGWLVLGSGVALVGASGAISGIVGMFLVLYPRNDVSVFYFLLRPGTFRVSSCWIIIMYFAFDLWGVLGEGGGVAYIAHVAGTICGAATAVTLLRTRFIESSDGEQNLLQVLGLERDE